MKKLFLICTMTLSWSLGLMISEIKAQGTIYGGSLTTFNSSQRAVEGYSLSYMDYQAGLNWHLAVLGNLYRTDNPETSLAAGYRTGYGSTVAAEAFFTTGNYVGGKTYCTYSTHFSIRRTTGVRIVSGNSQDCKTIPSIPELPTPSPQPTPTPSPTPLPTPSPTPCNPAVEGSCQISARIRIDPPTLRPFGTTGGNNTANVSVCLTPATANQDVTLQLVRRPEHVNSGSHVDSLHTGRRPLGRLAKTSGRTGSNGCFTTTYSPSQDAGNERSADRTLRGSGRVNASTLGMEFDLPLGGFPGRGINLPINLSYSSKQWRMEYNGDNPIPGSQWSACVPHYQAMFSEKSASGWTTSMAVPYIEYIGKWGHYDVEGKPVSNYDVTCPTSGGGGGSYPFNYIRRILVHLPSGETHELRPDDIAISSPPNGSSGSSPYNPDNWNTTYYAADSSNLKYIQNAATSTYKLLMPDGSFYEFDAAAAHGEDRKAAKFTDRNGNFTTYYGPGSIDSGGVTHPNGYWRDTLGRNISIPLGLQASAPTTGQNPQIYSMPGMTGTYKLHWKQLKGSTAAESGLTNFFQDLKYYGDTYVCTNQSGSPTYCTRPAGSTLFSGDGNSRIMSVSLFNLVVLTEIELPTGQKYKFTYDLYGRIEKIAYPTGGEEIFQYGVVATLTALDPTDGTAAQANFGVINRKVYPTAGQAAHYQWTYGNAGSQQVGYPVVINNPDGTRTERYLHPGNPYNDNPTPFGYDNVLAGMAFEERVYDNSSPRKLVSKKLTSWTKTITPYNPYTMSRPGQWHPRVAQEESIIYDTAGNGVSATTAFEYEGDLSQRETPMLMKKSSQYEFVTAGSPLPSNPVRSSESTFLINDPNYAGVKSYYTAQNMVGIVTASQGRGGDGCFQKRNGL